MKEKRHVLCERRLLSVCDLCDDLDVGGCSAVDAMWCCILFFSVFSNTVRTNTVRPLLAHTHGQKVCSIDRSEYSRMHCVQQNINTSIQFILDEIVSLGRLKVIYTAFREINKQYDSYIIR